MKSKNIIALLSFTCALSLFAAGLQARTITDAAYQGTMTLKVDLTDAPRKIFRVQQTVPVKTGSLTLSFPKWIPGEHGPTGPIDGVTGLKISAKGQRIDWRRDLLDMYSVNLVVPANASVIEIEFQFLSPVAGGSFGAGVSATPRIAILNWNQVLFYPAGFHTGGIAVTPTIKLPAGWGFATALEKVSESNDGIRFKTVSVNELVDSPIATGQNYRRIDLTPGAKPAVYLNLFADREANLDLTEAQIGHHRELVQQAIKLFGAQHYDHYDFLLVLSEKTNHFGLEHHQSSDDRTGAEFFTSATAYVANPSLLPHEYVHSWNGKFRRPASLITPDFSEPMKGDLLWVYEGLTTYLGEVLTTRSGMWTAEQYRSALAITAAKMDHIPGRGWRPLRDTADQAQVLYNAPGAWANYRRTVDFYPEGVLLWLDVDSKIRQLSNGKRTLDDFIRAFYGDDPAYAKTSHDVKPYDFDEVVRTLNATQKFGWADFLKSRLDSTNERAPLDGITSTGWKLVYTDTPTEVYKAQQKESKQIELMSSLGFTVAVERAHGNEPGDVLDVLWNSPAFAASLVPGMKIVAVDGEAFAPELLELAIKRAQKFKAPIELLVHNLDYYSTIRISYDGGLKYPSLERIAEQPDLLTPIVTPR